MWNPRRTLARQLILTYLLVAVVVAALLSLASLWAIDTLEVHLQRIDMGMAVNRIRDEYLNGRDVGREDRFFHGAPGSTAFPPWLRALPAGFSKIEHDGRQWHAMVDDRDATRYLLLRDYTEFEHRQQRSHWIAVASMAGALILAFVLGGAITRRFVRPLLRLAAQVGERPALPPQTRFAHEYPDNEIGRLAAAFDDTYNQLEAALQRERLFTADVGHELRTPLMVISSSAELLLDEPGLSDAQRSRLQRMHTATKEIDQQLAAYLLLSRGAGDTHGFLMTGAVETARDETGRWRALAAQRGFALDLETDEAVAGDAAMPRYPSALLRIVLSNLIRNALQHADGGTRILVRAAPGSLEVSDDGRGIAFEAQAGVFAPFVHGERADAGNLGLGLSLVQRICQHQRWRVTLDSAPGRGCRFRIDLQGAEPKRRF
ncbi:ATP-binding protein [Burkholderia sp. Ac-20379]|uniref:ATP-binding protein n=1 Tax=Burkholderia sp. Ac-20379 TaxID=2703900 RepID=UPI00197CE2C6|nr:HAMP domain-containing histidine kinase [Burkholderia sp. Ac-20379]